MKQIKIVIERSKVMCSPYAKNLDRIYGRGDTVAEVKQSILDTIELKQG